MRDAIAERAQDLYAGAVVVRERIARIRILVRVKVLVRIFFDDLADQTDRAVGALHRITENQLGAEGFGDVVLDLNVQRFEFTFEMAWKALKRYLDFVGIDSKNPRAIFKDAFAQGLLQDDALWLDMIEMRNLSSHVYDEREVSVLLDKIERYIAGFMQLEHSLKMALAKEAE